MVHSSIPIGKISWTVEPDGLYYMETQRVRHGWVTEHTYYTLVVVVLQWFTSRNNLLLYSKFSKPGFSNMWTVNFLMFKLDLEKAEEPEIKLPTSTGSWTKQESSRKTSISALLTMPKPLTVDHSKLWEILKEMGISDHLTCLLRNLYAGQEATVRTGHGTTDWFQIDASLLSYSSSHLCEESCDWPNCRKLWQAW